MGFKINISPILRCLPENIAQAAALYEPEEIRFICGQAVMMYIKGEGFFIKPIGEISASPQGCITASRNMINTLMSKLCDNSIYAAEDEIREGFVTVEGGHRVGICGSGVIKNGNISALRHISAINIRIARQAIGAANRILSAIMDKTLHSTLIISPPGCGKTTLLRDLARILGEKYKVGIADERSEIAAMYRGKAGNDIGLRSVVMDGCPKAKALTMLTRTMGIEIAVTDEIGSSEDCIAIKNALHSGVKIIATAHGGGIADISDDIRVLIGNGFERIITLSRRCGVGTIEEVRECS